MKKCEHVFAEGRLWSRAEGWYDSHVFTIHWSEASGWDAKVCIDCGAWLSLGDSNDLGIARIELRAAEIVATAYERRGRSHVWRTAAMTHDEADGVFAELDDYPFLCDANEAGYLARMIVNHPEQP